MILNYFNLLKYNKDLYIYDKTVSCGEIVQLLAVAPIWVTFVFKPGNEYSSWLCSKTNARSRLFPSNNKDRNHDICTTES